MTPFRLLVFCGLMFASCSPAGQQSIDYVDGWPPVTYESKPWTRWWWHGSALTREGITAEMESLHRSGIGGLEITPIYGVYGEEDSFIDYLSPDWVNLLVHVLQEADRLGMGIDMATGTGWPFGGPWIGSEDACKSFRYQTYQVAGGSSLGENVEFIEEPYLRLVGNNIYKPSEESGDVERVFNTNEITVADIKDPVSANENLQLLAIDQIQFPKRLKLVCLMGYSDSNAIVDLTSKVDSSGKLQWVAPQGNWRLMAIFEASHGKMVERAGPGGEGNVIDHFSDVALRNYLQPFDTAFEGHDIKPLRAFFNDSYEVDDARGAADFTPDLLDEFKQRRGYDLRNELPAFLGMDQEEKNHRVLCDYRETLSELLLEKFTVAWVEWAHDKDAVVRNQAHGAPSNILDLYAAVDIPETEGTEPLRFKMASSAGNVMGKRLVGAEAATWLSEHFESDLGDIRNSLDNYMLHGVNHVVYHGTSYSPPDDAWPGRLFYAAVHLNSRNPQWDHFAALNTYVSRCQSFLQNSSADNDVLLYYPIYDRFSAPGPKTVEHFDGIGGFRGSAFERVAEEMLEKGFTFDYISDKQLSETVVEGNSLRTSGNSYYKVIVVPQCKYMPLSTLEKLWALADAGAVVIFEGSMPGSPNGWNDLDDRSKSFESVLEKLAAVSYVTNDLATSLDQASVRREPMINNGIKSLRKKMNDGNSVYFVKNGNAKRFDSWLAVSAAAGDVMIYDPMTGRKGKGRTRTSGSGTEVFVEMGASQTLILLTGKGDGDAEYPYRDNPGESIELTGKWRVTFESGGPTLPAPFESDALLYWTSMSDESYRDFSGTATYALSFDTPEDKPGRWLLQIDSIESSAEIMINGVSVGTVIGPLFEVEFDPSLLKDRNLLELRVSNLMANRIAYMDRNNIFWKKFYNINVSAWRRENSRNRVFDAAQWEPKSSGVSGMVRLTPLALAL